MQIEEITVDDNGDEVEYRTIPFTDKFFDVEFDSKEEAELFQTINIAEASESRVVFQVKPIRR